MVTYTGLTPDGFDVEAVQTGARTFQVTVILANERMSGTRIDVDDSDGDPTPHIEAYLDGLRRHGA
jgi:hypothetical protein